MSYLLPHSLPQPQSDHLNRAEIEELFVVEDEAYTTDSSERNARNPIILPYRRRYWSLRGPCAKGQGDLVGKTF